MKESDAIGEAICRRFGILQERRAPYHSDWQDIEYFVRRSGSDFHSMGTDQTPKTTTRLAHVFDGTATDALEQLSSGLHSYLVSPTERWFQLTLSTKEATEQAREDYDAALWLDTVSEIIYNEYAKDNSGFNTALNEAFLDIGSIGTCCVYQGYDWQTKSLFFNSHRIQFVFVDENARGQVDTVYRVQGYTKRQLEQEFGPGAIPDNVLKGNESTMIQVLNAVYPSTDKGIPSKGQRKWTSVWVLKEYKKTLRESGFDTFPYHVSRWMKLANDPYGKGPAMKCLPDIRMLNKMEKTILKAGEKLVDPPLIVPHDAFLAPIATHPGAIISKESGTDDVMPLITGQHLPIGLEMSDQKRQFIRQCFYVDWLKMQKENKEMTAFEVQDRRDEKIRMIIPMLARQQVELLGPCIKRSFQLLKSAGRIPPPPQSLANQTLSISYISAAAKAQLGTKALEISRFLQDLVPMAQINPQILDAIDFDGVFSEMAHSRMISPRILFSPAEVATKREQRAEQEQMAAMAQVAEPASKAVKNVADAQAKLAGV